MTTIARPETRGQLTKEEVQARAEKAFNQIKGQRPWDKRRVIQKIERLAREEQLNN